MSLAITGPVEPVEARGFALAVLGLRCAMAELSGAPSRYRAGVWEILETAAPNGEAEALLGFFHDFARSLLAAADRPFQFRRTYCAHLCRDEWLAVSMIDAGQRGDVAGLLGAAAALLGVEPLGDALHATQALAFALAQRGLYLRPPASGCGRDLCPNRTLH